MKKRVLVVSASSKKRSSIDTLASSFVRGARASGLDVDYIQLNVDCHERRQEKICLNQNKSDWTIDTLRDIGIIAISISVCSAEELYDLEKLLTQSEESMFGNCAAHKVYLFLTSPQRLKSKMNRIVDIIGSNFGTFRNTPISGLIWNQLWEKDYGFEGQMEMQLHHAAYRMGYECGNEI